MSLLALSPLALILILLLFILPCVSWIRVVIAAGKGEVLPYWWAIRFFRVDP